MAFHQNMLTNGYLKSLYKVCEKDKTTVVCHIFPVNALFTQKRPVPVIIEEKLHNIASRVK